MTTPSTARNAPCPCGSGKKYKKCCMRETRAASLESARFHRLDQGLIDKMTPLLNVILLKKARAKAARAFWPRRGAFIDEETELVLHSHWLFFDWAPESSLWRAENKDLGDSPVAAAFLRILGDALDPDEVEALEAVLDTPSGFHEILEVREGQGCTVRDIFTGKEAEVDERSGSRGLQCGEMIFGKVVRWRNTHVLAGVGELRIPPKYKGMLIDMRAGLREQVGEIRPNHLFLLRDDLRCCYLDIRDELMNPTLPKLQNTDGDLLEFQTLHYEIDSPHEAAIALAGLTALDDPGEDPLDECRRDSSGRITEGEIIWSKLGNARNKAMENTILGHIRIDGRKMSVEVNSKRRAARIRREIEKRLGDAANYERLEMVDIETAMNRRQEPPLLLDDPPPEFQQYAREFLEKHYEEWPDHPVPALGGVTPRDAMKTPDGREKVEALLLDFERQETPGAPFDFSILRKALGLD